MKTIAISGKGGTGKTTLAALIVRLLRERGAGSVLAVDGDPNVNLNDLLGVDLDDTIGAIREVMREKGGADLPGGMSKQQFLEYKIQSSVVEAEGFDLLAMGRPEGPGCYCYANNLLRDILKSLSANYSYVVIDNEAGMEHLSRRTVQLIDHLLIVSDPTLRGIRAAGRISRLLHELDTRVQHRGLILNRGRGPIPDGLEKAIQDEGLELLHIVPWDEALLELDQGEDSIFSLPEDTPSCQAVDRLLDALVA
ncbi:MAG: AAA family ATPase [Candidatus Aminicenantaceae bacterium]